MHHCKTTNTSLDHQATGSDGEDAEDSEITTEDSNNTEDKSMSLLMQGSREQMNSSKDQGLLPPHAKTKSKKPSKGKSKATFNSSATNLPTIHNTIGSGTSGTKMPGAPGASGSVAPAAAAGNNALGLDIRGYKHGGKPKQGQQAGSGTGKYGAAARDSKPKASYTNFSSRNAGVNATVKKNVPAQLANLNIKNLKSAKRDK
jgi:hypothetical protein